MWRFVLIPPPSLERRWRHYVFWLSVCPSVRASSWTRYFRNHLGEFDQICSVSAFGYKDELLNFEVKDQSSTSPADQIWSKIHFWAISHRRILNYVSLNWFGCVKDGSEILGKMRSKVKVNSRPDQIWPDMAEAPTTASSRVFSSFFLFST